MLNLCIDYLYYDGRSKLITFTSPNHDSNTTGEWSRFHFNDYDLQ